MSFLYRTHEEGLFSILWAFSVYSGPFQSIVGLFSIVWAFSVYCGPFQYIVTFKNDHNSRDEFEIFFFTKSTLKNQIPYHFHSWNIL